MEARLELLKCNLAAGATDAQLALMSGKAAEAICKQLIVVRVLTAPEMVSILHMINASPMQPEDKRLCCQAITEKSMKETMQWGAMAKERGSLIIAVSSATLHRLIGHCCWTLRNLSLPSCKLLGGGLLKLGCTILQNIIG